MVKVCGPTWIAGSVIHKPKATGKLQGGNFFAKWLIAEL